MSVVRIVARIIPSSTPEHTIPYLLLASDIDTPLRTEWNSSGDAKTGSLIMTETTFCKENVLPPNVDLDSAIATRCNSISGLVNLKKSRLRLTNESTSKDALRHPQIQPVIKVAPEILGDGTCAGFLLSVPLRLSRSDIQNSPGTSVSDVDLDTRMEDLRAPVHTKMNNENCGPSNDSSGHGNKNFKGTVSLDHNKAESGASLQKEVSKYECSICGKCFSTSVLFHYHKQSHAKVFPCFQCGKKFAGKKRFVVHRKMHEEERSIKESKLRTQTKCLKKANLQEMPVSSKENDLKLNGKMPSTSEVYKGNEEVLRCESCNKTFESRVLMMQHKRTHTYEQKYSCQACGAKFKFPHILKRHMEQHEKESMWPTRPH